ncbi:MAG TPA: hypothetical protein VJ227_04725 [Patescibacteria group bacterium]|nr:hypothetical protein [Patescibacteria group bacterium]
MLTEQTGIPQNDESVKESFSSLYCRALDRLSANKDFRETLVETFLTNDGALDTVSEPIVFKGQLSVFSLRMGKNPSASEITISTTDETEENETVALIQSSSGYRLFSYTKTDGKGTLLESQNNNSAAVKKINQFLRGI